VGPTPPTPRPHVEPPHIPNAENAYTLRLRGDSKDLVTTHGNAKMHLFDGSEPTQKIEIVGSGETPF
jgi:hypothetical protein